MYSDREDQLLSSLESRRAELHGAFGTDAFGRMAEKAARQTRQADRDKLHSDRIDKNHERIERAAKAETDKLLELLQSNTTLTQEDKELTEKVAELAKQIHGLLTKQS